MFLAALSYDWSGSARRASLQHLVRLVDQVRRKRQPQLAGGGEVEGERALEAALDRNLGRIGSVEQPVDHRSHGRPALVEGGSKRGQAAATGHADLDADRGQAVL